MRTITATINGFLTNDYLTPSDLLAMPAEDAVSSLSFAKDLMIDYPGWFKVGRATITVEIDDDPQIIERIVDSIDAQIKKCDADHEMQRNALIGKKQSLLAIEYKAG